MAWMALLYLSTCSFDPLCAGHLTLTVFSVGNTKGLIVFLMLGGQHFRVLTAFSRSLIPESASLQIDVMSGVVIGSANAVGKEMRLVAV